MRDLAEVTQIIRSFKQGSLRRRVSALEKSFSGQDRAGCAHLCTTHDLTASLLAAAQAIKREASQIDEVVHAVGILVSLPHILAKGEVVESLSLAAGNTGRPFDLETDQRLAEFKFIDWKGGSESIRQNQLFKDFYNLAEYESQKGRYLYVLDLHHPLKFLTGGRALASVLSRDAGLAKAVFTAYGERFKRVREYFEYRRDRVQVVDLGTVVPHFKGLPDE